MGSVLVLPELLLMLLEIVCDVVGLKVDDDEVKENVEEIDEGVLEGRLEEDKDPVRVEVVALDDRVTEELTE